MLLSNSNHLLLYVIKPDLDPAYKFLIRIVISYLHCFILLGISQRGRDECCVREQWLSLSCQWELFV